MRSRFLRFASLFALVCAGSQAHAQNLPPPRILLPANPPLQPVMPPAYRPLMPPYGRPLPPMPLPPAYYRPSAYQVWQYYGITYSGQLRPRVIQATQGGYYLYRGYPFPYVHVYPGEHFNPIARD